MSKVQNQRPGTRALRRAALATGVVVLVAVSAACGGKPTAATKGSTARLTPTGAASTPTPSTTPVPALSGTQKAVYDRLLAYNDVMNAIMQNPKGDTAKIYTVARDPQARDDMKAVMESLAHNAHREGAWRMGDPKFDKPSAEIADTAVVDVCVDARDVKTIDDKGKDYQVRHMFRQAYTLTLDTKQMKWYVTDAELKAESC